MRDACAGPVPQAPRRMFAAEPGHKRSVASERDGCHMGQGADLSGSKHSVRVARKQIPYESRVYREAGLVSCP